VAFFLPFARWIVKTNAQQKEKVAREWVEAYIETNSLIKHITTHLTETLAERGVRAAAEPPTHNFDPVSLISRWSHKSVAVIAGLGSFGLHQMVITDSGCAGRFGSLVVDVDLPIGPTESEERCLYFHDGSCRACVVCCPVNALKEDGSIDKHRCYQQCLRGANEFQHLGLADVCGKCALGPCSFKSAV
jgi:epoxyqueuosine reductase QueG